MSRSTSGWPTARRAASRAAAFSDLVSESVERAGPFGLVSMEFLLIYFKLAPEPTPSEPPGGG
jgi:hypothetical protein